MTLKSILLLTIILLTACFMCFSCTKKEDNPLPTEGLVLYLDFNGNIADLSGNNIQAINCTSNNFVTGIRGKALDFNGTSDYIQLLDTINSENGLTFSFWIKTRGAVETDNNGVIIGKYNMTTDQRCFLVYSFGASETRNDNRLSAAFYKFGNSSAYHDNVKSYMESSELLDYPSNPLLWSIINPTRLVVGNWTHCVINVTTNNIEAWVNGILCTKKQREYLSYFKSLQEPLYIGNNLTLGGGSNNHFNGAIDELRIYDRGLTPKEIQILFDER